MTIMFQVDAQASTKEMDACAKLIESGIPEVRKILAQYGDENPTMAVSVRVKEAA